jgi:hypothetical protein
MSMVISPRHLINCSFQLADGVIVMIVSCYSCQCACPPLPSPDAPSRCLSFEMASLTAAPAPAPEPRAEGLGAAPLLLPLAAAMSMGDLCSPPSSAGGVPGGVRKESTYTSTEQDGHHVIARYHRDVAVSVYIPGQQHAGAPRGAFGMVLARSCSG